jgi:hypothetical protein
MCLMLWALCDIVQHWRKAHIAGSGLKDWYSSYFLLSTVFSAQKKKTKKTNKQTKKNMLLGVWRLLALDSWYKGIVLKCGIQLVRLKKLQNLRHIQVAICSYV